MRDHEQAPESCYLITLHWNMRLESYLYYSGLGYHSVRDNQASPAAVLDSHHGSLVVRSMTKYTHNVWWDWFHFSATVHCKCMLFWSFHSLNIGYFVSVILSWSMPSWNAWIWLVSMKTLNFRATISELYMHVRGVPLYYLKCSTACS